MHTHTLAHLEFVRRCRCLLSSYSSDCRSSLLHSDLGLSPSINLHEPLQCRERSCSVMTALISLTGHVKACADQTHAGCCLFFTTQPAGSEPAHVNEHRFSLIFHCSCLTMGSFCCYRAGSAAAVVTFSLWKALQLSVSRLQSNSSQTFSVHTWGQGEQRRWDQVKRLHQAFIVWLVAMWRRLPQKHLNRGESMNERQKVSWRTSWSAPTHKNTEPAVLHYRGFTVASHIS